jgi:hypothetical protein
LEALELLLMEEALELLEVMELPMEVALEVELEVALEVPEDFQVHMDQLH